MLILVRYGEIGLKSSQVRGAFEQRLHDGIDSVLSAKEIDADRIERDGRIFVDVDDAAAADTALALSRVPGVVSVSPVQIADLSVDAIAETALDAVKSEDGDTFAVRARRAGEHEFSSNELEEEVGQRIVDETGLTVDLDDPDVTVRVEARYTAAYITTHVVDGVGGLPISREARVAVALTDRAATVAAFRLMKRGCTVYPVYAGHHPDEVEDDIRMLRQSDPDLKLTTKPGSDPVAAVTQVADLYDCQAVAFPATVDDFPVQEPDTDREALYPNCGADDEQVLDEYRELQHFPV